jgi:hypothetical protein
MAFTADRNIHEFDCNVVTLLRFHVCPIPTQLSEEDRRLFLLAALLLPLRQLSYAFKNKQQPASSHIIRESLKWRVKEVEGVAALHAHAVDLAQVLHDVRGAGEPAAPALLWTGHDCLEFAVAHGSGLRTSQKLL